MGSNDNFEILTVVALRLLSDGAGVAELAERFSRVQVPSEPADLAAMLTYLMKMGLVRVANELQDEPYFVATELGQQFANTLPGGNPAMSVGLEELERLRTDFMSTIAHELRTPLTAMRMSIGLLLEPSAEPDQIVRTQLLENVARSTDRMQRLVTDLLDLVRFQAGHIGLQSRRFDARLLARDTGTAVVPLMNIRDQNLKLELPDDPTWIYADRRRLEQALVNLLSNAQKFSPVGADIVLKCQYDSGAVTWSVTDSGPGISLEDQTHLFERYFIGAAVPSDRPAGAGLGLPIALAIAQAHGGTILVDSVIGRGSTFTLSIPRSMAGEAGE